MSDRKITSARLKTLYEGKFRIELLKDLNLDNINEVPKIEKIVINVGLGKSKDDKKAFEIANLTINKITGQAPVETIAKQSIAAFKLREGNKIGLKTTLRSEKMYEFLDRLINVVLPRLRDFHGLSTKAFDRQGNYSIGLADQTVFPEINFEDAPITHGLQVTVHIKSKSPEHSRKLLEKFGLPFEKSIDDKNKEDN